MLVINSRAESWVQRVKTDGILDHTLVDALETSLIGKMDSPKNLQDLSLAEKIISERLAGTAWQSLNQEMKEEGQWDGQLRLWRGLVFLSEKRNHEAYREFLEATRVSFPLPLIRVAAYCKTIRDSEVGAAFPLPGQPVFGEISNVTPGKTDAEITDKTYYGSDYFTFQKTIGAFGGVANRFKFESFIQPSDVVVDFGSGGGYLLRNLICGRKLGIELNSVARREALGVGGIQAVERPEEVMDEFADVIVSNHALEHVHDPLSILKSLYRLLKVGGKMICVVPHEGPLQAYDPSDVNKHLFTWNPATLGNLFKAAGFKVSKVEAIQHQWPPDYEKIYHEKGEAAFHVACREQALRSGNYQIRISAIREPTPNQVSTAANPSIPVSTTADTSIPVPAAASTSIPVSGASNTPENLQRYGAGPASARSISQPEIGPDPGNLPVVLVAYKRVEHTRRVLEGLRKVGAKNVTIFLDGCKKDQDMQGVIETRRLCHAVDWVKPTIIERDQNYGLAKSIMAAADYMLDRHENMILLEDDCVPHTYFLEFMSRCLEKYRHDPKVLGISGYTVPLSEKILKTYPFDLYFVPRIGSWGWATWSRAWRLLERNLIAATRKALDQKIDLLQGGNDIPRILEAQLTNPATDTWTLNWVLTAYLQGGSFIYPTVSHIDNIGMDGTGVHCGATEKYRTPLAQRAPSHFPEGIIQDADILTHFRSFYDIG